MTFQGLTMRQVIITLALFVLAFSASRSQQVDSTHLTVDRIYNSREFSSRPPARTRWLKDGTGYTSLERSESIKGGMDIVRYDVESGHRSIIVPARWCVPMDKSTPLGIEDYQWSADGNRLLIFTNTARVWRTNTRGDYWVLNLTDSTLKQLGGEAPPSTLMFAKFSPDGNRVAYVRENNLYVEDLTSGRIKRLTSDGSRTIINGTFDWVYEEEFSIQDGFRWSPDGASIAYWQLDASGVRDFLLLNTTDSLYSFVVPVQYPKVGETLSACRIGVVKADGGPTVWLKVDGDPRNNYIPRMEWADNSTEVVFQYLNRLQNRLSVMMGDARTGGTRTILADSDSTWLDVVDDMQWFEGGKRFTWMGEDEGWYHAWMASRDGQHKSVITRGSFDVTNIAYIDGENGWLYFIASPENATQRYLYSVRLDGTGEPLRLSPVTQPGTHSYDFAPGAKYAFHTYSSFSQPPITELVRLPGHEVVRTIADNKALVAKLETLRRGPSEFFRVDIGNGVLLDGWRMLPVDFDPAKKYPVLVYVYGDPSGLTVTDQWGRGGLWSTMLTQKGYIVLSVDSRGTPSPRGWQWRKAAYKKVGIITADDQAAAIRVVRQWPYVDSTRVGVWGWSGGGSMTLMLMFRFPELYHTGMAVAPVSDQHLYDAVYQERFMGLPSMNEEAFKEGSAVTHAAGLQGNLLIVHGTGDDNVHYQNTERVVNALIAANKQFTMMSYPNRSHGIYEGKGTTRHLYTLLTNYLLEHLPPGPR
jgi:dipeptidyl-peptidase 4